MSTTPLQVPAPELAAQDDDWTVPPPREHPGRVAALLLAAAFGTTAALSALGSLTAPTESTTRELAGTVRVVRALSEVGDVDVRVVPGLDAARVTTTTHGSWSQPRAEAELLGDGVLQLSGDCGDAAWFWPCSVSFELELPAAVPLEFRTQTGDVDVDGAFPSVVAELTTGDFGWEHPAGGTLDLRSTTGDVDVEGAVSDLRVRATTGDVDVELRQAPERVVVETTTGDVHVELPADGTGYDADVSAGVGDVTDDVPVDPDGPLLQVRATTGDVTVRAEG
ncbi:DUF4097 family beta strand repeat-containing protein [Kineococcus glutinatus]|uniref:DUF4097 domain-containing protein n=1 Tax=Kineococcus glutinatus TaxID=1070872 RepID=A0ABP9HT73_9ACTN